MQAAVSLFCTRLPTTRWCPFLLCAIHTVYQLEPSKTLKVCKGKIYELDTGQQCFRMFIPDPTKNKKIK
jgi:hypothetical protein